MKVVSVFGGLGSQMFKYAFYLALKERCHDECMIDTSFFLQKESWNGYELGEVFGIEAPDLKNLLSTKQLESIKDGKNSYIDECLRYLMKSGKTYYYFMGKGYDYSRFSVPIYRIMRQKVLFFLHFIGKHYQYSVDDVIKDGNAYFDEYFHNSDEHFSFYKNSVKEAFRFAKFDDKENIRISTNMESECSVAVHIRRTDHLGDNGKLITEGYYNRAINFIKENEPSNLVFYVFSDDLEWCKAHKEEVGFDETDNIMFVGWNNGSNSYKDMQLMTFCKHNVLAISSFSWWGYYLSDRTEKIVCAPAGYWTEVENHF